MWLATVTERGRRLMATWRKEDEDAARHRQEKREANESRNPYRTWKRRTSEVGPIGLVDEPKESCTGMRRVGTCVAPRHVDA